ncbi:hypothetical protein ACF0H5_019592 [Mactra antiquata]
MSPPAADSTKDVDQKSTQRKVNKPLIEKRRRARINDCLSQLKTIVLNASESKTPRPSKLEKADILEMTVDFVKNRLCSDNGQKEREESADNAEYFAGYSKCLHEISKFLENTRPVNSTLRKDIVEHMSEQLKGRLQSSDDNNVNEQKEKLGSNIQQTEEAVKTEEAIDLRTQNNANTSQVSSLNSEPQSNHNITFTGIQNTSAPIGLMCGGQIMLLVQIPPQQTPMTSYQINQSQIVTVPMTSYPLVQSQNVSNTTMPSQSNQPQNDLPLFGAQTAHISSEKRNDQSSLTYSASASANTAVRSEQSNCLNKSHWRPW